MGSLQNSSGAASSVGSVDREGHLEDMETWTSVEEKFNIKEHNAHNEKRKHSFANNILEERLNIEVDRFNEEDETITNIEPVHLFDMKPSDLQAPGVFVGISILPKSPLLTSQGSHKLVSFLSTLPYKSIVLICDGLNKHNVQATWKKRTPVTDDRARQIATASGDEFHKFVADAINKVEQLHPEKVGRIKLLRWADIEDDLMIGLQEITEKYYKSCEQFKDRVDKIAMNFLTHRRPQSRHHNARLPYAASYILNEIPSLITGIRWDGETYLTLAYPTTLEKATMGTLLDSGVPQLMYDIHILPQFAELKEELVTVASGRKTIPG